MTHPPSPSGQPIAIGSLARELPNGRARPASRADRWLRYPLLRWRNYLRGILPKPSRAPESRFLLLCRPRSGSHFLMSLLQQHPEIHVDNEKLVFHRANFRSKYPATYLHGLSNAARRPVYLSKTHINRIAYQGSDPKEVLDTLQGKGWQFVYLYRANLLEQAVSHVIALERNVTYDTTSDALASYKLTIPVARLQQELERAEKILERETALLAGYNCLVLEYGRDLKSPDSQAETKQRVMDFLGVPARMLVSPIRKTAPKDLANIITNYDELVAHLAQGPYARFLNSDGRF